MKINSKCIRYHNVSPENLNLLQGNIKNVFENTGIGNNFLNRTLVAHKIKTIIDKLNIFCTSKKKSPE
jgi:hypothetical protein